MCTFSSNKRKSTIIKPRRGWKIIFRLQSGRCESKMVGTRFYINGRWMTADVAPTLHNTHGFYIWLDKPRAPSLWLDERLVEVEYKGRCVYGEDLYGDKGVRAQYCRTVKVHKR